MSELFAHFARGKFRHFFVGFSPQIILAQVFDEEFLEKLAM